MPTENNLHDDHVQSILDSIRNGFAEKQLASRELDIINTYVDIISNKKLPISLLSGEITSVQALDRVGEYNKWFGRFKSYDKYFEINGDVIKRIINPDKNLKITFVDLNDELGIVLHNMDNEDNEDNGDNYIFQLYIEKGVTSSITISDFRKLKEKFEDKKKGLKLLLNDDLTNKLGTPSENTRTITIEYATHFSGIDLNELETVYLFPAIDTEGKNYYKHKITFVMFFAYRGTTVGTVFYDTFQICPPDGCK
ncbi:hypothetical protein GCM10023210_24420 [Chryseobacterium ginsengisoli]|uniref:Uncharacterized protein n=1 Tax=Chryseobacterium ginsengisoli TaxID=363853 RepID=A0ABP9MCN0_9FLAO